jgi:hypothetical protein
MNNPPDAFLEAESCKPVPDAIPNPLIQPQNAPIARQT